MQDMTQADIEFEKTMLTEIDDEWKAAVRVGAVERALSYWSDDATVLAPGFSPVVGKEAIRAFITSSFQIPGFAITWVTERWTVARGGDMAWGVGHNTTTYRGPDGNTVTVHGKSATVWRKDANGWKCVLDVWNDMPNSAV